MSLKRYCHHCKQMKPWFRFRIGQKEVEWSVCFDCERWGRDGKLKPIQHADDPGNIEKELEKLIKIAMRNKMSDLRNHLFETLENLKDNLIEPDKAKIICSIAQTLINSAKVEVDFLKATGGSQSQFMQIGLEDAKPTNVGNGGDTVASAF